MALLSAFDLFGVQPGLTIDNSGKFKSFQGFLLTVIAISITIVTALTPVKNWLYRLSPLIVQETKLNTESTFIGGKANPIYFGVRCLDISKINDVDLGSLEIIEHELPQPKITQIIIKNGKAISQKDLYLDRCFSENSEEFLLGFSINSSLYCLSQKVELYDRNNGSDSSRLLVQYERNKFEKIFYGSNFKACGVSIIYQNTYMDASDYNNFTKIDVSSEEIMAKPSPELLFQTLTFKKQTFKKALPLFSRSSSEERVYSTLDKSYARASVIPPIFISNMVPILIFTFEFSKKEDIFNLKYFEFQDLVSTIGGTFGLIISILRVLSLELNKFPMKAQIMNSVFKFYKLKENNEELKIELQNKKMREHSNIQKRKFSLIDTISNRLQAKLPDKIDILDLYKTKLKILCKRKLSNKEEFIKSVEEYVIKSSNIENISKLSYIVGQLSNIIIGPSIAKFISPPEMNLEKGNFDILTLNNEILFNNNAKYDEIGDLNKILEDESIKDNIKEYIIKKYEESNK